MSAKQWLFVRFSLFSGTLSKFIKKFGISLFHTPSCPLRSKWCPRTTRSWRAKSTSSWWKSSSTSWKMTTMCRTSGTTGKSNFRNNTTLLRLSAEGWFFAAEVPKRAYKQLSPAEYLYLSSHHGMMCSEITILEGFLWKNGRLRFCWLLFSFFL